MDAAHDLTPQHGGGVAQGLGEPLVGLIARPHSGAVIRGEAREVTVAVFVGGTGLAGDGHAGEPGLAAGTAGDDALEGLADDVGGGLLHGHMGFLVVLTHQVALGILHPVEGPGRGIHAIVDEGPIGRGH